MGWAPSAANAPARVRNAARPPGRVVRQRAGPSPDPARTRLYTPKGLLVVEDVLDVHAVMVCGFLEPVAFDVFEGFANLADFPY